MGNKQIVVHRDQERTMKAVAKLKEIKPKLEQIRFEGKVLYAGWDNEEYQQERSKAFAFNDCAYPAAIFLPKSVKDVSLLVKALAPLKNEVKTCIAGGRHSHFSYVDNAVVIDLQHINEVKPNIQDKYVDVGGGAKLGTLDQALSSTGYGIVTGTNPDTGVGGLTLAGGWGFLARKYGFAVDNLIEVEVVLANGDILVCRDDNENSELLRVLRGGGCRFGIVTRFRFILHDVTGTAYGTIVRFAPTKKSAFQCIKNYDAWLKSCSDNVTGLCVLPCGAPVIVNIVSAISPEIKNFTSPSQVPEIKKLEELSGQWFNISKDLKIGSFHLGLQKLLEPIVRRGNILTSGHMISNLTDELIDTLIRLSRDDYATKTSVLILASLGGKTLPVGYKDRPTSIRHRHATHWLLIEAIFKDGEHEKAVEWIAKVKSEVIKIDGANAQPVHGFYDVNNKEERVDEIRKFLELAKKKYDPDNFFSSTALTISEIQESKT